MFIFGCVGSSFLCEDFLQPQQAGATLHCSAQAPHCRGPSCCGAQAPDTQAQQLWLTGPVAPRHVGSSQTRARTRVPCIDRQTLNHCATREALFSVFCSLVPGPASSGVKASWRGPGRQCVAVCVCVCVCVVTIFGKWMTTEQPDLTTCGQMT